MKKYFLIFLLLCLNFGLFAAPYKPAHEDFSWKNSNAVTLPLSESWIGLTGLTVINIGAASEFKVDENLSIEACATYFSLMGFFNIGSLEINGRWYPAGKTFFMSIGAGYKHYWAPEVSGTLNNEFSAIIPSDFFETVNISGKLGWKIMTNKNGPGFFVEPSLGYDYPVFIMHSPEGVQREILMALRILYSFKVNLSLGWAF